MADERFKAVKFSCVHAACRADAQHAWSHVAGSFPGIPSLIDTLNLARCGACGRYSFWVAAELSWPGELIGDPPHPQMPEDVRDLYSEAQTIAAKSPRSAAALQRLALQTLIDDLVPGTGNLNHKIGRLVERGLPTQIQQAMDVIRVVGNNGAHPGEIDLKGDGSLISASFQMMNLIVEEVIARPRRVQSLFDALPNGARTAIAKRDGSGASLSESLPGHE